MWSIPLCPIPAARPVKEEKGIVEMDKSCKQFPLAARLERETGLFCKCKSEEEQAEKKELVPVKSELVV